MEQITGDFQQAIDAMCKILDVKWKVLPVTLDKPRLVATMKDWKEIIWEENLDKIWDSNNILKIKYDKKANLTQKSKKLSNKQMLLLCDLEVYILVL